MTLPVQFVPTICPYCGTGCGLILVTRGGNVIDTLSWRRHPVSDGRLCAKGWKAHEFIHHSERLKAPLLNKQGSLQEVDWDTALKAAARIFKLRDRYGPSAVGILSSAKCTNEENYVIQKFARVALGTNNIDHCARLCHAPSVAGLSASFGSGAMTNSIDDLEQATCILVIGSDTTSQHPLIARRITRAKERGASLIVADPRAIHISHQADILLPLYPGSEVALLNALIKVILDFSLEDLDFIARRTEGIESLKTSLADYTLEEAERATGIPAEDIKRAALLYAGAERGAIVYAMGITQHITGTDNVTAVANLAMLTGNLGKKGTGVNPLRGQNNVQGSCDMGALPDTLPGYRAVNSELNRKELAEAWSVNMLPVAPGLTVVEMLEAAQRGELKALYVVGENPMMSDPDLNHVAQALEHLELLIVQDIFLTETAGYADIVLPSASWAEKDGTFTSTERRVQRIRKAVMPPGIAMADWAITSQLARTGGYGQYFPYESAEDIFDEIRQVVPQYHGITYERLNDPCGLTWPCPSENHPGTPMLHSEHFTRGNGQFYPVRPRLPAETPDEAYPLLLTTGRVSTQWHSGSMTRRSPSLEAEFPAPFIEINPHDAYWLGITNQCRVKVISRRGNVEAIAQITDRVKPGVAFMPFHYAESAANRLTGTALDPRSKIPEFKVTAVTITPLTPGKLQEDHATE